MTEKFKIGGQEVEVTDGGNYRIHIHSLYKSAGKVFKFPHNSPGISLNQSIIQRAEKEDRWLVLNVAENRNMYLIRPKQVIDIVNRYGSVHVTDNGTNLFVIPIRELKPCGGEK